MTTQTDRLNGLTGALGIKAPVRVATTANITLSGTQTIDGVAVVALDRVLVKDQTNPVENGIYVASATAWARAPDFDGTRDAVTGTMIYVVSGTANAKTSWRIPTTGDLTPGTTSLTFEAAFGTPLIALDTHAATTKATPVDADELPLVDSAASNVLKKLTWANLKTVLAAACSAGWNAATATTATNTGGKTTIASATTPDIFATTVGTIVDYTGTATCTGFVAAPQAGATKRLICAGDCLFTAGANLLIEGIPSGTTITLAAKAIVDVTAINTTQFKITYSLSGTFTATGTGFTANPTATAIYSVKNGIASIYIPELSGTSNANTFTVTGMPSCLVPVNSKFLYIIPALDNGGKVNTSLSVIGAVVYLTNLTLSAAEYSQSGSWTTSGTKRLTVSLTYPLF